MDEKTKDKFKWKFYGLTVLLNIIILVAACIVISFFLAPGQYKMVIPVVLLVLDLVLIFFFVRSYRTTKKWLDEQP
jgi:hypothetical protein